MAKKATETEKDPEGTTVTETPTGNTQQGGSGAKMVPETQYVGLQRKYERLYEAHEDLKTKHEDAVGDLEESKVAGKSAEKKQDALQGTIEAKDQEIQDLKNQLAAADRKAARQAIIAAEYPALVEFDAQGLLPEDDDDEAWKEKLDLFQKTMGVKVDTTVDDKLKGAGPSGVSTKTDDGELDNDALYDRLAVLAGRSDPESQNEYAKLHRQWLANIE